MFQVSPYWSPNEEIVFCAELINVSFDLSLAAIYEDKSNNLKAFLNCF